MKMSELLKMSDVNIENVESSKGDSIFYCSLSYDNKESKMEIIEMDDENVKAIVSYPVRIKMNKKALESLNKLMKNVLYGAVYLDGRDSIRYRIMMNFPENIKKDFALEVFDNYKKRFFDEVTKVMSILRKENVIA